MRLLVEESALTHPGAGPLVRHLLDALFVYVLRAHARGGRCAHSWLAALDDPALGRALAALHARPAQDWTVASLARVARLSRATFARRFSATLAEAPLAYLTRLRMTLAVRLLASRALSVAEVAQQVGYTSEFAFSRAFKRVQGLAPTVYRSSVLAP